MYQLNFLGIKENRKILNFFEVFFNDMIPKPNMGVSRTVSDTNEKEVYISMYCLTENKDVKKPIISKAEKYLFGDKETLLNKKYNNYNFTFVKSINSKFSHSSVYGLKELFKDCPDILMDKDTFKKTYKNYKMPEYNYDLRVTSSFKKELMSKLSNNDSKFKDQVINLLTYLENELIDIFSSYGEVELVHETKNSYRKVFHIKNTIDFHFILEIEKNYKFVNDSDNEFCIVPNYKLNVKLREGSPKFTESNNGSKLIIEDFLKKEHYFKIELRYLDFVKNKSYFVLCMTPHGYIRLKKEYSKEFLKKLTYHYLFKRYFEKYGVSLSHEELENNPQSFFNLISLLKY